MTKSFGRSSDVELVARLVRQFGVAEETLEQLAERLGVSEILRERLAFDGGVFANSGAEFTIKLNSLDPRLRQRFTLAHEIGHLLLATAIGAPAGCARDEELESACDSLAAELLMPADKTMAFVRSLGSSSPDKLQVIARTFDVSLQVAARRVHQDLRLWPDREGIGLWQFDKFVKELWFVGRRPWVSRTEQLSAVECALSSVGAVKLSENYMSGCNRKVVRLEVIHLGGNRVLGLVG